MTLHELSQAELQTYWRPIRARLLQPGFPNDWPFSQVEWSTVLLPGGIELDQTAFQHLAASAQALGDKVCTLEGYREEFEGQPSFLLEWKRRDWSVCATDTVLGHIDCVAYGKSAAWALFTSPETFALLSGSAAFMSEFQRLMGGVANMRAQFLAAVDAGDIGFGEESREFVAAMMRRIGW